MAKAYLWAILHHLLLLLLVFRHVDSGSVVKFLPGFDGPLPIELETGYIGVGKSEETQLFYYFVKSERNPEEDPILIWLNGGPGCSALYGFLFQMGPLAFKDDHYKGGVPALITTSYSWTKVANIIYLDQPVGAGFSYARTPLSEKPSDTRQAVQVSEFVRKWLADHPEFISNPFYVSGDSYAGMVVPGIVQRISEGNEEGLKPLVNLQGYALGNPGTEAKFDYNYQIPYAHGMGLISDEIYESLKRSCEEDYISPTNAECIKSLQDFHECVSRLFDEFILIPNCDTSLRTFVSEFPPRRYLTGFQSEDVSIPGLDCYERRRSLIYYWANDESVREALHVVKGSIGTWVRCRRDIPYEHDLKSSIPYHLNNSVKGFRSLIFSGDHDLRVPFLGTQAWIRSLNYSIVDDWRPWLINNQIAGYTRTYANKMTFATIKGCGHTVEFKPDEGFKMFQRWINGESL